MPIETEVSNKKREIIGSDVHGKNALGEQYYSQL